MTIEPVVPFYEPATQIGLGCREVGVSETDLHASFFDKDSKTVVIPIPELFCAIVVLPLILFQKKELLSDLLAKKDDASYVHIVRRVFFLEHKYPLPYQ